MADNRTMTELAAFAPFGRVNASVDNQAELATAFVSSGTYYQMLGVNARLGRTIAADDDRPTAAPVAVISSCGCRAKRGPPPIERRPACGVFYLTTVRPVTVASVLCENRMP